MRRGVGWYSLRHGLRSDGGSTVLEVLATVLLLSVLGLALASGVGAGVRLVRRTLRDSLAVARLAQVDRRLRQAALRVRTPLWESGPDTEAGPGWLRVAWVDGEPGEAILLEDRDGLLVVRVREEPPAAFGPFAGLAFDLFRDAEGGLAGLQVSLAPAEDPADPLVILAPFGGSPLLRGAVP